MPSSVKGAAALMRIRDGQLYREDHDTFDTYFSHEDLRSAQSNSRSLNHYFLLIDLFSAVEDA